MSRSEERRTDDDYQQYLWGEACPRDFARRSRVVRRLRVELADVPLGVRA